MLSEQHEENSYSKIGHVNILFARSPLYDAKKFFFSFASTVCNFLEKVFRHSKNVDTSIIAQKS